MVDWDEDGRKDLIIGMFSGRVAWYRNIGMPGSPDLTYAGYLEANGRPILVDYDSIPLVDDWDEDGRKDLLVGDMGGRVWLFLNMGTNSAPLFNRATFVTLANGDTLQVTSRSAPYMTDLDGDGFEDLILGQINGNASFYRSLGENPSPQLANPQILQIGGEYPVNPGSFSRFASWDWEGDGRMDLLGGAQDGQVKLFRQIPLQTLPLPPYLEVNFQGPTTVPDSGAVLNFTCWLGNQTAQPLHFDVWADLFGPNDHLWMALESATLSLDSNQWIAHEFQWRIPASAPYGFYQCFIFAGDLHRLQVTALDTFWFDKVLDAPFASTLPPPSQEPLPEFPSFQASPNPFNPTTTLSFHLPVALPASLRVYDLNGRLVATLWEGVNSPGDYQILFEGTHLPSGMYFVKLNAGDFSQTQKVMLQK